MKNSKFPILNFQKGFALFMAIAVTSTLLLIATGVVALAAKQSLISSSGRESQLAFHAADSAMECALYWDVGAPSGISAFDPSSGTPVYCNHDTHPGNDGNQWVVGGSSVSTMGTITFAPEPYCAVVTVRKEGAATTIEARGYNTCDEANSRRVERAVRATY